MHFPFTNRRWGRRIRRPPGPTGYPLVGSLFEARSDPLAFALRTARRYGDISYYRVGPYKGYLLNRPEFVRHVLRSNRRNYSKENPNYRKLSSVIGDGLITSSGEEWQRQRRRVQPAFHRDQLGRFATLTTRATHRMLARWDELPGEDAQVDIMTDMTGLTLEVIARALFGTDLRGEIDAIERNFSLLNRDLSRRFQSTYDLPLWVPTPRNLRFVTARRALDRIVAEMIDRRRRSTGRNGDLLDGLLAAQDSADGKPISDRQIRDQVMTLLLAGHETTAALLTWTWDLLTRRPSIGVRLRAELRAELDGRPPDLGDLPRLRYTRMVLEEALRLYPPVWIISRTALEDDEIGGYTVPAGSVVTLIPFVMHRHPRYWDRPTSIDPERFAPNRRARRPRFAFFPFGGGPRRCIGSEVAFTEALLVVATVAQRYRFSRVSSDPVKPEPLITLRPRRKLTLRLHRHG